MLVACALLAVLVAVDHWANEGRILDGVSVSGVDVGGKTPTEARGMVEDHLSKTLAGIQVSGPEGATISAEDIGIGFDAGASVDQAYDVGRKGNVAERLVDRLRAASGGAEVSAVVGYQQELVTAQVRELAARVNEEPQEATVSVEGTGALVGESREGYELDVPATMVNVQRAVEDATGEARMVGKTLQPAVTTAEAERAADEAERAMDGEVVLFAEGQQWTLSPEEIGAALDFAPVDGSIRTSLNREDLRLSLPEVFGALTLEPVEAGFEFNGSEVVVTGGQEGQRIEEEQLVGAMEAGLFEGKREYEVPVVVSEPELTTSEAEALRPAQLLASYRTEYALVDDTEDRVDNLRIASDAVSGTFVAPGETFSMNDTVSSLDYNETKVIIDGQETRADGGGLCQVTSTLYMAANYSGLDVTERHPHYAQLPYIRPGLDATVWFGDVNGQPLDMKFENTTGGYVYLREYVADDGYIYAEIYGQPNGTEVEMTSESTYMGEDLSKWTTYQKVTKDGEVLYDGVFHKDNYEPLVDDKGEIIPPPEVNVPPVQQ